MGRFQCQHCDCTYYDKRFLWEPAVEEIAASQTDVVDATEGEEEVELEQKPEIGSDPDSVVDNVRTTCDSVRASGTVANLTGMVVPAAHGVLGPVSCAGGLVGMSCGMAQLRQGLTTPSGLTDPHLVAKGGVTTAVGGTCMVLGACASVFPPLFFAAAGLGVSGLCTATMLDANMSGLCLRCRNEEEQALQVACVKSKRALQALQVASERRMVWKSAKRIGKAMRYLKVARWAVKGFQAWRSLAQASKVRSHEFTQPCNGKSPNGLPISHQDGNPQDAVDDRDAGSFCNNESKVSSQVEFSIDMIVPRRVRESRRDSRPSALAPGGPLMGA